MNLGEWKIVKLENIQAPKKYALVGGPFGSNLVTKDYVEQGIPVIRGTNLSGDHRFSLDDLVFVSEEKADDLISNNAHPGDVVFTQRGTLGQIGIIPKGCGYERFVISQSQMKLTVDETLAEPLYIYYFFKSPETVQKIHNLAFSSGVPHINLQILREFEISLPPLPVQRKIAAVLSVYDDLIEVNARRIRLLEEMAQAVYREWFVSVDAGSLPEGWKVRTFSDVCNEIIDGDWIETKDQGGEDYRLLQVSNIGLGDFVETGNFRYITQETFERLNCNEVIPGDILVSRMPTPIGRGWLVTEMSWRMITAVDVAIVRPNPELLNPFYCVHWLNSPETLARSEMNASGTTRPRITRRVLSGFDLVIPPIDLQNEFGKIAGDIYEMQTVLRRKNANLRRTRDLLLPRLVSGEVTIDGSGN